MEFSMQFQEVVEAEGHLIDSHIMENIFDQVVEYHCRFEVQEFRIGRTNSEGSYLRMKVDAPDALALKRLLESLLELGCAPVDTGDAALAMVERDRCAPEDFYSTTNQQTHRAGARVGRREGIEQGALFDDGRLDVGEAGELLPHIVQREVRGGIAAAVGVEVHGEPTGARAAAHVAPEL